MSMQDRSKGVFLTTLVVLAIGVLAFGLGPPGESVHKGGAAAAVAPRPSGTSGAPPVKGGHCPLANDIWDTATMAGVSGEATGNMFIGQRDTVGPPCEIVAMASCMLHDAPCNEMCIAIGCDGQEPPNPNDNVEPRLQKGDPPTLVLDLGTCGCPAGEGCTATVACTPNAYAGTAGVACDGSSTATVTFSTALPDQSCCTLTFSGDIVDARTIVMLEGDVDRDCYVTTADESTVCG